jgi:hypothetical protein
MTDEQMMALARKSGLVLDDMGFAGGNLVELRAFAQAVANHCAEMIRAGGVMLDYHPEPTPEAMYVMSREDAALDIVAWAKQGDQK